MVMHCLQIPLKIERCDIKEMSKFTQRPLSIIAKVPLQCQDRSMRVKEEGKETQEIGSIRFGHLEWGARWAFQEGATR